MRAQPRKPGSGRKGRNAFVAALAVCALLFLSLGIWQIERRSKKLALIAAVDARAHAPATPPPPPADWPQITSDTDAYRHVAMRGMFAHDRETLVQAVTDLGAGYWVLTPLKTDAGWSVLVNRGFVLPDQRARAARQADEPRGPVTITGLLRISEPKGSLLRSNEPRQDRWYSRDVAAIGRARGVTSLAPYFVDADAAPAPKGQPLGGLTVIAFYNHHLEYALTWFAMAILSLFGIYLVRRETR